ncbi:neuronal acetylcholine receptor subunit alpha-9 [Armigeres subalbatus]|uniref:neuronal acetylcholine receptor subunit alpha-9 n=1 Tax=Armigeres subalbatus TaxID=124917 RepID=UPI002ED5EDE8
MWLLALAIVSILVGFGSAESKYNVTYADLDKCKQYNAVSGYNYHAYFKLEDLDNHNLDNETVVNLRLFVVAAKDAHVLLSDSDSNGPDSQVYEIVIGAGANTFSEIRKQRKKNPLKTKSTKGVLSPIDPLPLRIRITRQGLIEVGIEGQDLPLMSATDKSIIEVKYLSFSSWGSTMAKWFYDCPSDDESTTELEEMNPIKDLTPREKLLYELQLNTSFTAPDFYTEIYIKQLVFTRVSYDSWKNTLEARFFLRATWNDNRTIWVPEDYGNITRLVGFQYLTWNPSIFIRDDAEAKLFELYGLDHVSFTHDGRFEWLSKEISTETYCPLRESPDWPFETNECDLAMATDHATAPLKLASDAVSFHPNIIQSDWNVDKITKHEFVNTHELFSLKDGTPRVESVLRLHLRRNNEFYDTVLYAPYFVASVMILVAFWLDGMHRILVNTFGTVMLIATFLQISVFVPATMNPKIFTFFHYSLYFSFICILLFILDKCLQTYGGKVAPDSCLTHLISYPYLRIAFRLDGGSNYDSLHRKNIEKRDFVTILDRVAFLVLAAILVVSIFKKI